MSPRLITAAACILALAACDQQDKSTTAESGYVSSAPADAATPAMAPSVEMDVSGGSHRGFKSGDGSGPAGGESYIYTHNLTVSMASEFIKLRFDRARDLCQTNQALKCTITSASFSLLGEPDAPLPVANLTVALPHDSVALFETALMQVLPDETASDLFVKSRQTNAQNVTNQVKDIESRLSQLTNYRDRMMELSKRKNAGTDDLIKIEGEISRTQAEIEQIEGQKRDLAERIAKETLQISFEALSTASDAFQPVRDVWQSSWRLLASSAASAIGLIVGTIPWIPVFLIAFFGLRWVYRRSVRKST